MILRFGDIIVNEWAGDSNPRKVLMVISNKKALSCISLKGHWVSFDTSGRFMDKVKMIGRVNFQEWNELANEYKEQSEGGGKSE